MNAESAELAQHLGICSATDFVEAAEAFRGIGIKVERENGAVVFSAMGSFAPHARGQSEIVGQVWQWANNVFDFFWFATDEYLTIGRSSIVPDVSAGPMMGRLKLSTFACEISDRNPVTQERIDTYHHHPEIQYLLVIEIGWYDNGDSSTLTSLTAELYDIPSRSRVGGVIPFRECTEANPAVITIPCARLFQGAPIIPPNATDLRINLFRVKKRIMAGIDNL